MLFCEIYKFVLIWHQTMVFLHLMGKTVALNEVNWPLGGSHLRGLGLWKSDTAGARSQMKEVVRRWQDRNRTALLSTCRLHCSSWYRGAPAEWHHGNKRAPHWLAKLLQISTSDSLIESLAYKEVSWGHDGEVMWGFPLQCPWSSIMTTEHL